MNIQMFNFWYFFWVVISVGSTIGLYFLLRKKSPKTQKIVLFCILIAGLIVHFTKFWYPPYSTDPSRLLRDSWFVNICGANIALFPFMFISKSERAKDYMFYLGLLGGLGAVLIPIEPIQKVNQAAEWIDIIRFYFHHTMLYAVPLLMVMFKLHKLSYKRVLWCPVYLLGVMLFIMLNQIFQSELGFIPMRGNDIVHINYKNTSFIWGPPSEYGFLFTALCPKIFSTIPFGEHAGETKYWPWFWLIVPVFVYITPLCFGLCMIFDHKNFKTDCIAFNQKAKAYFRAKKNKKIEINNDNSITEVVDIAENTNTDDNQTNSKTN